MHIGLIGCGRWGKLILRDLIELGCDVSVVAHSAEGRANAQSGGAILIVDHLDELAECSGYVVAASTSAHASVIQALLPRGVPIFCEKPLSCDLAAAERLVAAAASRLFVMDKWRYHRGVLELARIARSGELGQPVSLNTQRLGWGNPHPDVNIAWILLPHDLSIAQEIFGALPEPRWAKAIVADGRLLQLDGMFDGDYCLHVQIGARSPQHWRRIELHCRDGVAVLADAYDAAVLVARNPPSKDSAQAEWEHRAIGNDMPLRAELAAFVAYLAGAPAPKSSAVEALASVRAIDALHRLAGIAATQL